MGIDAQQRFWERISSVMDDGNDGDPAELPDAGLPTEIRFDFGAESGASAAVAGNARKFR
jgi:hypothetical protein